MIPLGDINVAELSHLSQRYLRLLRASLLNYSPVSFMRKVQNTVEIWKRGKNISHCIIRREGFMKEMTFMGSCK